MGLFNEHPPISSSTKSYDIHESSTQGIGFKLTQDGNYDIDNKKLVNIKYGDSNNDAMVKSQIETYVSNKTQYLDGVLPGQVTNNKAVIYSPSGGIHSNGLYLRDQNGQEAHFINELQDLNQCRLYIPNLKDNDSFGGRLKSSVVVTSINQTIEGKKIFHDIEVPTPTIDGHASNKAYVDNEISKISDASDNSNYVKKSGDTMLGSLIVPKDNYPVQGDLNKVINYEATREIFLSRKESRPMNTDLDMGGFSIDNIKDPINSDQAVNKKTLDNALNVKANTSDLEKYFKKDESISMSGDLQMNNNRIYKLPDPLLADEPATLGYVSKLNNNLFNSYLDLKGSRKMEGNIQMDGHQVSGLTNFPQNDDHGANKKYVGDKISKAIIKPSNIPKNVFKYIMQSTNEWSVEYNLIINSFSDLKESPHSWNKKVLNITPKKTNFHYRFRFGVQVFPVDINTPYTICIELFNRDYITWSRTQIFIEGLGIWLRNHKSVQYQHHYDSNGDLYYHRTIINFNKTSISGPSQILYTIHYNNRGGDLDTYPDQFKDQLYVVAYGCKGYFNNIDSLVYDKHEAYEIDKTKMKMLVDLDMNNKSINNIENLSYGGLISIYGRITKWEDTNFFSNMNNSPLILKQTHIHWIKIHTSNSFKEKSDTIVITLLGSGNTDIRYQFNHPDSGDTTIVIDRFFERIRYIKLTNGYNLTFELVYKLFY